MSVTDVTDVTGAGAAASRRRPPEAGAGLVCRTWTLVYRGAIFIFIHEESDLPACPQVRRSYIERQL